MKKLILLAIESLIPPPPSARAEEHAQTVLAGLKSATDGWESQRRRKNKTPSVVKQKLRYKTYATITVGESGSIIVLQANPRLESGYALAKGIKRVLIRELAGKGVTVSLKTCYK